MLKTFLGKPVHAAPGKEFLSDRSTEAHLDRLKAMIEFFPIGKRQRYYPEFKKEIVFDTFIVAYCVNGEYIYSLDAIEWDAEGYPAFFRTGENGEGIPVAELDLFQLLVPDTSDLELTLDYERRALLGRGKQFVKGNYISLISSASGRGQTTVDTEVAKRVILKDGPYAQTKLVLLSPEFDSLLVTDQRKKVRAKIMVPVMLSVKGGPLAGPCTIIDISDGAVRVRVRDHDPAIPEMRKGDDVVLVINLAEMEQHYTIKGSVMRRLPEICVMQLDFLFRNGRFSSFGPLDHLELKAALLNYGS